MPTPRSPQRQLQDDELRKAIADQDKLCDRLQKLFEQKQCNDVCVLQAEARFDRLMQEVKRRGISL